MARPKRNSDALEKAGRRLESLRSIDINLDLGNGLTIAKFSAAIQDLAEKLAIYNTSLSEVDKQGDDVRVAEKMVTALSEKMLLGVGSQFGKTSQEYEMAGGRRRKSRNTRQAPKPTENSTPTTVEPQTNNGATAQTNGV
jgi:hypothetical protein